MLKRKNLVESWHDRLIPAGTAFADEIDVNLERSDIVLLLVSPEFLASNFCYDIEMKRAMERHLAGECVVMPVILRPCDWQDAPFGGLNAVPKDGKPVVKHVNVDDAFLEITNAVKALVAKLGTADPAPVAGLDLAFSEASPIVGDLVLHETSPLQQLSALRSPEVHRSAQGDGAEKYTSEIEAQQEFFGSFFGPWVGTTGHLQCIVYPTEYVDARISKLDLSGVIGTIGVAYGTGSDPEHHMPALWERTENTPTGIRTLLQRPRLGEYAASSLSQSGFYRYVEVLREDFNAEGMLDGHERFLRLYRFVRRLTLLHLVARDAMGKIEPGGSDSNFLFEVRVDGLLNRRLELDTTDVLAQLAIAKKMHAGTTAKFLFPIRVKRSEFARDCVKIAATTAREVLWTFGLNGELVEGEQKRMLGRNYPAG